MTEEIFDVVNENDDVIGQRNRSEVHRLGLMHRAAHVLVFNSRGQVFLQKRSLNKDRQPGLWDSSSSGHLNAGESYEAAARRELEEEIGLHYTGDLQPLFRLRADSQTDQEHVSVYRCQAEGPFRLEPAEIERGGWFSPQELNQWVAKRPADFASAFLVIWRRIGASAGSEAAP